MIGKKWAATCRCLEKKMRALVGFSLRNNPRNFVEVIRGTRLSV
jgi:hypothetical protein